MAEYQAKSKNSITFEVTKGEEWIGRLSYTSWFRFDARIELEDNMSFQVLPKGFWGTTIEIKEGVKLLLKFKMNWNGQIVVQTFFNAVEEAFIFKHRGIFKESFLLVSEQGTELLVMKPILKWTAMGFEYQITTSGEFEALTNKEILLLNSIHCANYYMSMMMAT